MASCPKCGKPKIKRKLGILRCRRCGSSDELLVLSYIQKAEEMITKVEFEDDYDDAEHDEDPGYDHMTRNEFHDCLVDGLFTDADGHYKCLVGETELKERFGCDEFHKVPKEVTHVRWFNK